jgi:hypothetical protein
MNYVIRLADPELASTYPLSVGKPAHWIAGPSSGTWQVNITLPAVPEEHIIVPSFVQIKGAGDYHFEYCNDSTKSKLQNVPAGTQADDKANTETLASQSPGVSTHIDCWHTLLHSESSTISLCVTAPEPPKHYLLVVSVRPITIQPTQPESGGDAIVAIPESISQMQADQAIRSRICSPTALVMALSKYPNPPSWLDTIQACFDPISKAYGSWPLAIRWAGEHGVVAAVETFDNWQDALHLLQRDIPLICSIRFATGALQNAPLPQTGGHLVLLYGVEGNTVLVKDPAAPEHNEVNRRYQLDEFIDAWLSRRGAAYILAGPMAQNH